MKIKKLQGGGFATFTPIISRAQSPAVRPQESKETKESDSLLDKDLYKKLIDSGGLVNDVNHFVEQLQALETNNYPFLDSSNRNNAISMIGKVNELIQSRKYWEESASIARSSGGLGEIAVDSNQRVYTRDKDNKIQAVSLEEYKRSKNKPTLLTVSQLLEARNYDEQLVGNTSIFSIAQESIGIGKVTDKIKDLMSLLAETVNASERHYSKQQLKDQLQAMGGRKPTDAELASAQQLMELISTPGDYLKIVEEVKTKRNDFNRAFSYITGALDPSYKNKLSAVAAVNGKKPEDLIVDMLLSYTEPSHKYNVTPESETDIHGASAKATDLKSMNAWQMFHKDSLMSPNNTFAINDPVFGTLFHGMIGGVSPLITPDGKNIGMNTVSSVLGSGYNQVVQGNDIYYGGKKIDPLQATNLIYDGQDAARVYMPVDSTGAPDYKELENFKKIYTVYENNKDSMSVDQAENYFRQNGYNLTIDEKFEDGRRVKVIRDNAFVKPFLVMYAYTNDATDMVGGNEDWLYKLTSKEEDSIVPILEKIWTVGTGKNAKNNTPSSFWNIEEYYKGMVALPYREGGTAIADAMAGQGPRAQVSTLGDVQRNIWNSSNQPLNTNNSSDVLNNN